MDVTDWMEKRIAEHVDKLPRLDGHITRLTITLARDAAGEQIEIIARCHRSTLVATAVGHDLYAAMEEAFARIERQITRLHGKLISRHAREAQRAAELGKRPQ
jgi:ribosomal subunit interface protein